jgi:hypothetical protein
VDWATAGVSFLSAIGGGLIVHYLSLSRERIAKRREILVRGKMELWKLVDQNNGLAADSAGVSRSDPTKWEEIVREVQLLGTDDQIKMVKEITDNFGKENESSIFPRLMKSPQNELRNELGMKNSTTPYFWVRINTGAKDKLERDQ